MSHTDDPPFLTVGTEVSAKYRGAFCEATIKIAKKLVKCKVSFAKGQTELVSNDVIKGSLKVGSTVEVKQTDGQSGPATLLKLTDQSTYTVVFDDGDERTLKRSSLCLKGGRHFDESESLDHTPLTDPENFGTPVMQLKKSGRKRRRPSNSPVRGEEMKRKCYPPEFPVGKAVFLENDRRRSSWLPAVIVPAHYFMDESEMAPDTICLRSFKDGRFFAATKGELHDFAPDKEPLLSMLEGDVQPMYMCKPAIERAMAYLDTAELPWDMDLFETPTKRSGTETRSGGGAGGEVHKESDTSDEETVEMSTFTERLKKFHESRGTPVLRQPTLAGKDLNLFRLFQLVQDNGGMERVTQELKWRSLYLQLGIPITTNASHAIKLAYKKYLHPFEVHEKEEKARAARESPTKLGRRGRGQTSTAPVNNNNEVEKPDKPEKPIRADKTKQDKPEKAEKIAKQERDKPTPKTDKPVKPEKQVKPAVTPRNTRQDKVGKSPTPQKTTKQEKVADVVKVEKTERLTRLSKSGSRDSILNHGGPGGGGVAGERGPERDAREERLSDGKSDSDTESQPDSTSNGDGPDSDRPFVTSKMEGVVPSTCGYAENDRILVCYGKGKNVRTYEARIVTCEESTLHRDYLVHYNGWNNRYDEWIEESRIYGRLTSPFKAHRSMHSKRKSKPSAGTDVRLGPTSTPRKTDKTDVSVADTPPHPSPGRRSHCDSTSSSSSHSNGESSGRGRGPGRPPKRTRNSLSSAADSPANRSPTSPDLPPAMPDPMEESPAPLATPTPKQLHSLSPRPEMSPLSSPATKDAKSEEQVPVETDEGGAVGENSETEETLEMDEAIVVKKEENTSWLPPPLDPAPTVCPRSPPSPTPPPSPPTSTAAVDALLCAERLPSNVTELKPAPDLCTPVKPNQDRLPPTLSGRSSDETLSSCGSSSKAASDTCSSPERPLTPPSPVKAEPSSPSSRSASEPRRSSREREDDKSSYGSSEEKDGCSPTLGRHSKQALLPEARKRGRDHRETEEEYQERKRARRTGMNFLLRIDDIHDLSTEQRILLIQERLRAVQHKWHVLKQEVSILDRKRRRARRREKEAARSQANQSNAIECH